MKILLGVFILIIGIGIFYFWRERIKLKSLPLSFWFASETLEAVQQAENQKSNKPPARLADIENQRPLTEAA